MITRTRQNLVDASDYIEKLLESTNQATKSVATLHVSFILFATYLFVIIWGTTHEDLLFNSPIELPILSVKVPLTIFYGSVPWMIFLLHFNLLLQLELLSRKLWSLNKNIDHLSNGDKIRERLGILHSGLKVVDTFDVNKKLTTSYRSH